MGAAASTLPEGAGDNAALRLKLAADSSFQIGSFKEAIYWYTKSLHELPHEPELFEGNDTAAAAANHDNDEMRSVILANRCASYLKMEQFVSALADAKRVIIMKPHWYKGYYRAALASFHLGRLEEARPLVTKAVAMLPKNASLIELRAKIFGEEQHSSSSELADTALVSTALDCNPSTPGRCATSHGAFLTDDNGRRGSPAPRGSPAKRKTAATVATRRRPIGAVYSWGLGADGQLGQGSEVHEKSSPGLVSKLDGHYIIEAAAGALHSVAISGTGETFAWGDNNHHQLGFPKDDFIKRSNTVSEPVLIPTLVGLQASAVACGAGHTLVLMEDGSVWGWGMSAQGQLGLGLTAADNRYVHVPTRVPYFDQEMAAGGSSPRSCVAITTGIAHSFFLMSDGTLRSVGMNGFGQLGLGNRDTAHTPQQIVDCDFKGGKIKHVSCGGAHTLVVNEDGLLFSCGSNSCGQLGTGNQTDSPLFQWIQMDDTTDAANVTAVAIAKATTVVNVHRLPLKIAYVYGGEEFSAFISRNKHVYTCGLGIAGSLGHGDFENRSEFKEIRSLSHIEMLTASGQSQVFAINSTGEIYSWGGGSGGVALGTGVGFGAIQPTADGAIDNNSIAVPVRVSIMSKRKQIRQLSCGRKHNIIVINGAYGPNCHVVKGLTVSNAQNFYDTHSAEPSAGEMQRERLCKMLSGGGDGEKENDDVGHQQPLFAAGGDGDSNRATFLDLPFKPLTTTEAGRRLSFVIQSRNVQNEVMETPGASFLSSLVHIDSLDYELRIQRQKLEVTHEVDIDDNLDGTYTGSCRLYLTGCYHLDISLDGLPISGAPFELEVFSGALSPPRCFCWFGSFAIATAVDHKYDSGDKDGSGGTNDGYGTKVQCLQGQSIVFTVSARDKYGNKCAAGEHQVVVKAQYVEPWVSQDALTTTTTNSPSKADGSAHSFPVDTETQTYPGSSLGLFPCAFDTRECLPMSVYKLHISIDYFSDGNGRSSNSKSVQGSPFHLAVKEPYKSKGGKKDDLSPQVSDRALAKVKIEEDKAAGSDITVIRADASFASSRNYEASAHPQQQRQQSDPYSESEELVRDLCKAELTQRRAEQAFKKMRADSKAKKERERAAKKVKRTGGGFIIKYSQDI